MEEVQRQEDEDREEQNYERRMAWRSRKRRRERKVKMRNRMEKKEYHHEKRRAAERKGRSVAGRGENREGAGRGGRERDDWEEWSKELGETYCSKQIAGCVVFMWFTMADEKHRFKSNAEDEGIGLRDQRTSSNIPW